MAKAVRGSPARTTPASLLARYDDYLQTRYNSPDTVKMYRYVAKRFLAETSGEPEEAPDFFLDLEKQGRKENTLSQYHNSLRAFFKFQGRLVEYDALELKYRPARTEMGPHVTPEEFAALRVVAVTPFEAALVATLYGTGVRLGELLRTTPEDVRIEKGYLRVEREKQPDGERYTFIPIEDTLRDLILRLIREGGGTHVFGESEDVVRDTLDSLCKRAGIRHLPPHAFRRGFGTELGRKGVPEHLITKLMGHRSPNTTKRYVWIDKVQLKQSMPSMVPATEVVQR